MLIEKIKAELLKPAKYNPRKDLKPGDKEYEKLKRSIQEFGYVEPIIWNKTTGNVVGGHQRLKVLISNGESEIDCVVVELTEEKEKALNIALNKISGEFDIPLLTDLLKDIEDSGFDVSLTGFDIYELNNLFGEDDAKEDDFDAEKALEDIKTPISQQGDIWLLGKHRLICGDSTKQESIEELMDNNLADLVLTDPPYNVDYKGTAGKILNDKMKDEQFLLFLTESFKRMFEFSKKGAAIYVFHADSEGFNFRQAFKNAGYTLRQCLVWVKNSLVLGRQDYNWKHEPILYGWKDGASHSWYSDRKQTTVINYDKPSRNAEHPTMKPVGLVGYLVNNSSKEGDIILDPFGGSGSTLIACEQLGRICYTSELDEKYADVIVKRFVEQVGSNEEVFLVRNGIKLPLKKTINGNENGG